MQTISSRDRLRPSDPPALQLLLFPSEDGEAAEVTSKHSRMSACTGQQGDEKHQ